MAESCTLSGLLAGRLAGFLGGCRGIELFVKTDEEWGIQLGGSRESSASLFRCSRPWVSKVSADSSECSEPALLV